MVYRKIQDMLSVKTALYQLHSKHYRMSPASFKRRTSEVGLPPKIYELYEQVVKECEHCQKTKVRPVKSSASGVRAIVFGDLIFAAHTDVKIDGKIYAAFVITDAATNFLWAYP